MVEDEFPAAAAAAAAVPPADDDDGVIDAAAKGVPGPVLFPDAAWEEGAVAFIAEGGGAVLLLARRGSCMVEDEFPAEVKATPVTVLLLGAV